jgi:hypothetical protein
MSFKIHNLLHKEPFRIINNAEHMYLPLFTVSFSCNQPLLILQVFKHSVVLIVSVLKMNDLLICVNVIDHYHVLREISNQRIG